ncbi:MAG: lytic transglycosylase domain-containing protein [Oscillospiraceae bacterium]|nr:lytic transglycosylase domain-containing protein [Oscillospiraceae bacterium]
MTLKKTKRKKKFSVTAIIITFLIIAIIAVLGKTLYDYLEWRYLLNTHPIEYSEYVEKYAREYEIDKFLLYAVIKTESGFKSDAVSNMGARGLMQIMEETYNWLKKYRFYEDGLDFDDMFIPSENIRFGSYLIRYHLNQYNGDMVCATAAYFVGDQRVNGWLADSRFSSDGKTLKEVPDPQTKHYVNKVKTAYDNYIMLYN